MIQNQQGSQAVWTETRLILDQSDQGEELPGQTDSLYHHKTKIPPSQENKARLKCSACFYKRTGSLKIHTLTYLKQNVCTLTMLFIG